MPSNVSDDPSQQTAPVWIVDDDPSIRFVLEKALQREQLATRSFASPSEVVKALGEGATPQVLISDIRMPGGSGIELLSKLRASHPSLPVIVMTAYSDLESAVSSFQGGAFEYLPKPFDVVKAVELIRRAMDERQREDKGVANPTAMPELLGQASAMQEVFRAIGRLSHSHVTVLITGESGTGKELVAQALHRHSPRRDGPFVAINTAAIPKDLLESELFGHERGAFTGAQTLRRGRFEQADSGTLFLDEIGDMPLELQTRLLRVLADGQFYRVGGHQPLKSNVRVIAATHQRLEERVKAGSFREDLFHRLNVIRLQLPPLRERREDIKPLAQQFMLKSSKTLGVDAKRLSKAALKAIEALPFPGNVRQLENLCHWLTVMAPAAVIEPKDLPKDLPTELIQDSLPGPLKDVPTDAVPASLPRATTSALASSEHGDDASEASRTVTANADATLATNLAPGGQGWAQAMGEVARQKLQSQDPNVWDALTREFESMLIQTALGVTKGRRIEAAQRLGIGRNTITRKIQELGLDDD
jgi:two-component system, NtrC family, nitrogen regulation response regulator GlnG